MAFGKITLNFHFSCFPSFPGAAVNPIEAGPLPALEKQVPGPGPRGPPGPLRPPRPGGGDRRRAVRPGLPRVQRRCQLQLLGANAKEHIPPRLSHGRLLEPSALCCGARGALGVGQPAAQRARPWKVPGSPRGVLEASAVGLCRPRLHRLRAPSGPEGPPGGGAGGLPVPWSWCTSGRGWADLRGARQGADRVFRAHATHERASSKSDSTLSSLRQSGAACEQGRGPRRASLCLRPRAGGARTRGAQPRRGSACSTSAPGVGADGLRPPGSGCEPCLSGPRGPAFVSAVF